MIWIDDRAGSKELVNYPPLDKTGELCRLDAGDVCLTGEGPTGTVLVGVEVKSITDLISSTDTGRLQGTQIPGMLRDYDVAWLLYYGEYRPGIRDQSLQIKRGKTWRGYRLGPRAVPYGYVAAFLLTLVAAGIRVQRVVDVREAAVWIGVLERWWSKPWDQHKGLHAFDNSRNLSLVPDMDAETLLRARVAAQLPGVGFERAMAAARYFGTVREMVNASAGEWEKIEGIGRVVAGAAEEAVR